MERDFMGLKANDCPAPLVKEEIVEESKDSAFGSSPGDPCALPGKVSAVPHLTTVKYEHDEKPSRMMFDAGASHEHMNFAGAHMKQQVVSGNLVAGATESRASEFPTQLTIFYGGTVNVFDDISPEKVQAIMNLAANILRAKTDVQMRMSVPGTGEPIHISADRALANQSLAMPRCSAMPSLISVSSVPADQSDVAATHEDFKVPNTMSMPANLAQRAESPGLVISPGPVAARPTTAMLSAAVPQARKASLARFLEKRKERVMKVAPYNQSKKAGDSATPELNNGNGFSATSGVDSSSVSSSKETNA